MGLPIASLFIRDRTNCLTPEQPRMLVCKRLKARMGRGACPPCMLSRTMTEMMQADMMVWLMLSRLVLTIIDFVVWRELMLKCVSLLPCSRSELLEGYLQGLGERIRRSVRSPMEELSGQRYSLARHTL